MSSTQFLDDAREMKRDLAFQRRDNNSRLFFWGVLILIAAKLWLTSNIQILPIWAPHDALNYVEHARDILTGRWFGTYSDMTLIKEPFFPIYLALIQEIGFPLPLANQLLYAAACLIACIAVQPLIRNGLLLASGFAILLFNPTTYAALAWVAYRSDVNVSLALGATACAIAILVRRRSSLRELLKWWIGLGLFFSAFWLTREEAVWLLPSLVVILSCCLWYVRKQPNFISKFYGLAIPVLIWGLSMVAITTLNGKIYGWNTVVETKAPAFVSAYNSLARIISTTNENYVPVPKSSLEIAYRVSPAARELEPTFEGPIGRAWTNTSCSGMNICDNIAGGWFIWAFRDAVAAAGHYGSGGEARAYYVRLAAELDRACDSGKIRCRPKGRTLFPMPTLGQIPSVFSNFAKGAQMVTTFSPFTVDHWPDPMPNAADDEYTFVTGSTFHEGSIFSGWILTDRPMIITLDGPNGVEEVTGSFHEPSPDIAAAFSRDKKFKWDALHARFSFRSTCQRNCFLVLADAKGQVTIPLGPSVTFKTKHILYHLDGIAAESTDLDAGSKRTILASIRHAYQILVPLWSVAVILLVLLRAFRAISKRRAFIAAHDISAVAVAVGGGALLLALAVIQTTSFPALEDEYLASVVPLMLLALSFVTLVEALTVHRLARRRFPSPSSKW